MAAAIASVPVAAGLAGTTAIGVLALLNRGPGRVEVQELLRSSASLLVPVVTVLAVGACAHVLRGGPERVLDRTLRAFAVAAAMIATIIVAAPRKSIPRATSSHGLLPSSSSTSRWPSAAPTRSSVGVVATARPRGT